jgi:hypothetical protein
VIEATTEISKMILTDMSDSRTVQKIRNEQDVRNLKGGAVFISLVGYRTLVRSFGDGTEGRLCSLPKESNIKYCFG